MNVVRMLLAGAIAAGSSTAIAKPTAEADVGLGPINNQYICTFDASVPRGAVRSEAARAAGPSLGEILYTYEHTIRGFAVRLPADPGRRSATAELKRNNPKVADCEQDQLVKALVQGKGKPGGGGSTSETTPWGISRVGGAGNGVGKTAWVIDSGIDLTHPDLNVDVERSRTFIGRNSTPNDQNGHGTHVAGTIAAIRNNGIGVVGVAAGATVVSVRVLDRSGSGTTSGVIAGVEYVAASAAAGDVANMSLGGGFSQTLNNAVISASSGGVWFTIAAGNSGADANNYSPASAEGAYIHTVAATNSANGFASWSNYGRPPIDWAEPGVSILSTYKDGGYSTLSGTSMAAPHLAGILLLGSPKDNCGSTKDSKGTSYAIGCR